MELVTCPIIYKGNPKKTLFLAGGVSGCPDWQIEVADKLRSTNLVLLNPRRPDFDADDRSMRAFQIEWEHMHLLLANKILFWFPMETLCPITLFEYGKWFNSGKQIFVATHPKYARRFDVEKQTWMDRPDLEIGDSLDWLIEQVKNYC